MSQGKDVHECIDCGQQINIYKREQLLAGMCSKCVEKEKKVPLWSEYYHESLKVDKNNPLTKKVIADVKSRNLFGSAGGKVCRCSATELRYKLFFNHTWIEYCPKCGAQSPQKPEVNKPSLSQNNKKEDGFPPTPKGMGIQPTIL